MAPYRSCAVRGSRSCAELPLRGAMPPRPHTLPASRARDAALKMVLERKVLKKNDAAIDFVTDAYATVAVAYHRAAGVYTMDKEMQELGTAAVHLLTMASSYIRKQD